MSSTNYIKYKNRSEIVLQQLDHVEKTYEKLPAGMYDVSDVSGPFQPTVFGFDKIELIENLIRFKSGAVSTVLNKCSHFFSDDMQKSYEKLGVSHKMGIIMYGPPGTGKTCTAQLIMSELSTKYNAICVDVTGKSPSFIMAMCDNIRDIQDNPIVMFMDEAERALKSNEEEFLTLLDSTSSINKSIFIGCTNFFNQIPKRIRERRSRIKLALEIKSLPMEVYKDYISSRIPEMSKGTLSKFAFLASEACLSIDELKHSVIDYYIDEVSIEDAINEVKKYKEQEEWQ